MLLLLPGRLQHGLVELLSELSTDGGRQGLVVPLAVTTACLLWEYHSSRISHLGVQQSVTFQIKVVMYCIRRYY